VGYTETTDVIAVPVSSMSRLEPTPIKWRHADVVLYNQNYLAGDSVSRCRRWSPDCHPLSLDSDVKIADVDFIGAMSEVETSSYFQRPFVQLSTVVISVGHITCWVATQTVNPNMERNAIVLAIVGCFK
jgi:hypothetical protein